MKKIKKSKLTKEFLRSCGIYPCDEERHFQDVLDDVYPEVEIGQLKYLPARVLRDVDPIAFRCGVADHFSSLVSDGEVLEIDGDYYFVSDLQGDLEKMDIELVG